MPNVLGIAAHGIASNRGGYQDRALRSREGLLQLQARNSLRACNIAGVRSARCSPCHRCLRIKKSATCVVLFCVTSFVDQSILEIEIQIVQLIVV